MPCLVIVKRNKEDQGISRALTLNSHKEDEMALHGNTKLFPTDVIILLGIIVFGYAVSLHNLGDCLE